MNNVISIFARKFLSLFRNCGGYKNTSCTFDHPLEFIPKFVGSKISCDVCLTKSIQSGWHCDCGFDIC